MTYVRLAIAWCLIQGSNLLPWGLAERVLGWALRVGTPRKQIAKWWVSSL